MIYLNPPYMEIDRLTILPDFSEPPDPLQFYYFPVAPRLALNPDGSPSFLFVKYRQDLTTLPPGSEPGGGFLNFDVDLHVDQDELDNAKREIRRQKNLDQDPRLAPLDYRTGKTHLIFLDYKEPSSDGSGSGGTSTTDGGTATATAPARAPQFVEFASYAATPSLYGDNRAAFSVELSAQGATLLQGTLDARTSLIGVVFDLTFVGLRPAYSVRVTVDWNRVYDYMETQFKASFVFASVDIDNATEKLIENQAIQIDVVSFGAGNADADIIGDKDSAVAYVKQFITEKFFQPSIDPAQTESDKWYSQVGSLRHELSPTGFIGYTSKKLHREDVKNLNINLMERTGEERRIVPQGHLQGLLGVLQQYPKGDYIRPDVDLTDPWFQQVSVDIVGAAAMATDHIDHILVHLEYGPDSSKVPQDILLNASGDKGHVQWALDPTVGRNYQYRYEVYFRPDAPPGKGDNLQSPTIASNCTRLVIDPRDLYEIQKVKVQAVNVAWDRYTQVQVDLRYEDSDAGVVLENPIMLTQSSPAAEWDFRLSDPTKSAYKYQLTFYPVGAQPIQGDWQLTLDPAVIVTEPYPTILTVMVTPAGSFDKIQDIWVTMTYSDPANNILQNDLLILKQPAEIQKWSTHIADRTKRDYTYQVKVRYKDGTIKDLPPVNSTDPVIFVGDVFRRTARVTISATGKSFSDASLSKVRVRLSYDDDANQIHDSQEVILTSLDDKFNWSYEMMDPARDAYTYQLTYFTSDGFQRNVPAQASNAQQLVIPIQ